MSTEKTITVTFTEDEFGTLLNFLDRGIDDLSNYVKDYGDEYEPEDRIEDTIQAGADLLTRLYNL